MPPGNADSGFRLGPFFESAKADDGASMVAVRPFYSREVSGTNSPLFRSETDILWPLAISSERDDRSYWRALLFYGTSAPDASDEDVINKTNTSGHNRFRLFPIFFSGTDAEGEDYMALFPFGGTIHNFMLFSEVRFVMFPVYAEGRTGKTDFKTVMWPFYLERHGENIDQLRLWPFYGESENRGRYVTKKNKFVLWPIWSDYEVTGDSVNGSGFLLFPLYGHTKFERKHRGTEESWTVLPPFFQYGYGDDGYRKIFAPWPFIRIFDRDDHSERHLWPLYGNIEKGDLKKDYFLWPFISRKVTTAKPVEYRSYHAPMPFYFRRVTEVTTTNELLKAKFDSSYTRLWPLFSHRTNAASGMTVRFPELSLWSNSEQIERNWAPLWSLYLYRKRPSGAYVNDILWGFLSWGRNDEGDRTFSFLWIPFMR